MNTRANLALLLALSLFATGCAMVMLTGYNYYVEARNSGKEPVTKCVVTSAKGFWHQPGTLGAGFDASIAGPFKQPYADVWAVAWTTAKGDRIEKSLDLRKSFPKPFQGRLVFIIDGNNTLTWATTDFSTR